MADRFKLRRGPKNKIDLNVYELGYATDSDEERLYFNNGSMVPIPNNKDITDIKTELTETTNATNKNKQDVSELKESVAGIIKTGVAKLVQYSYDIELSENTKKVNIPYERYSSVTDTLKVYVNGLAIQNDQYTITDPVENEGIVTNGYIVLKVERPAGTIVRIEVWKNVPSGEEGEVNGNIISENSLPLNRIIGINDITSQLNNCAKQLNRTINYYVSPSGSDSNNGLTVDTPFKTIQHAINILPKVLNASVVINLAKGNYDEDVEIVYFNGGIITIQGGTSLNTEYNVKSITVRNSLVSLNGLNITTTERNGITIVYSTFVSMDYLNITGSTTTSHGISTQYSNCFIQRSNIANKKYGLIAFYLGNIYTRNNTGINNEYGIGAIQSGMIAKEGTQPEGTTNEYTSTGGVIR